MKVNVYSLQKILFQGDAKAVNCPTTSGEITILDGHEPLISILKKGVLRVIDENRKDHYVPIDSGFAEVRPGNEAKFLIEETVTS